MQSILQNKKVIIVTSPAAIVDNASLTCNVIDTVGYDHCRIEVIFGAMDIAAVAVKVTEADAKSSGTALTSPSDVTGLVYGTSTNIAGSVSSLPSATDDNKVFAFDINCGPRKRYLLPVVTCGDGSAGTFATVIAHLSRAEILPVTAADQGCADVLQV